MKKSKGNQNQQKKQNAENTEDEIISSEEIESHEVLDLEPEEQEEESTDDVFEIEPDEQNAQPEDIILESSDLDEQVDEEIPPNFLAGMNETSEQEDDEVKPEAIIEETSDTKTEPKPVVENIEITNKQKIKAIKRSIEAKTYSLDRERSKVRDWRVQAKDRDDKATSEYESRKLELTEMLKKTEERYTKRIEKTRKMWHEYSDTYEQTKIKRIEDDLVLLQTELTKFEEQEPAEAK